MGADTSKSGGYVPPDTVDHGFSRHPPIESRSKSVPIGSGGGDNDGFCEDDVTLSKEPLQRHRSTMVVVNRGQDIPISGIEEDPLMKKLEELHFFYPLMHDVEKRSGLFGTHNRRALADIQSKIESLPALKIVRIYEDRLKNHAESISFKQGEMTCAIKEIDLTIAMLLKSYSERAKVTAKSLDRINKLDGLKKNLSKCQETFNECLAIVDLLNDMLPDTERLEPLNPWADADEEGSECKET